MGDTSGLPTGGNSSDSNPQLPHHASGVLSPLTADGRTSSSAGWRHQIEQDNQNAFADQLAMNLPPSSSTPDAYNMTSMGSTLPSVSHRGGRQLQGMQAHHYHQTGPPIAQQISHTGQYGHQQHHQQHMAMIDQSFYGQFYLPGRMSGGQNAQLYSSEAAMNPNSAAYYYLQHQTGQGSAQGQRGGRYGPRGTSSRYNNPITGNQVQAYGFQGTPSTDQKQDGRQNTARGPPRKPRQSAHAVWIGNLPPQTDLMSLVQHVCKEAPGLQSLFLISKSNCAFANYKDEATCILSQKKIHDSKFNSVRLVSRLRKSNVESASGLAVPTGPTSTSPNIQPQTEIVDQGLTPDVGADSSNSTSKTSSAGSGTPQQDKFFILKSLTLEDLELSVRTGIWATQAHNEESLNGAFKNVENVYLVFSANKSGEYFGYAKMLSEIDEDPAAAIEFAPSTQAASDVDLPKAIPTDDTAYAPRGKIFDDSVRGTIFWEADRDGSDAESDAASEMSSQLSNPAEESVKTWGKPFKLEWLSTTRLPFYRTRGLRNPWNSNREVKIARDGTELEPSVGRRLIGLFNRMQHPGPQSGVAKPLMGQVPPVHPLMRPYKQ